MPEENPINATAAALDAQSERLRREADAAASLASLLRAANPKADNTDSVKSPPGTESTDPDGDARSAAIALMHAAEANDCLLRDIWAGNGPPTLQAIFRGLSNAAAEYVAYLAYSDGTNDWRAKAGLTSASATPDTLNDVIAGATAMGLLNDDTPEPDPALDAEPEQIGPEWTFTPSDQSSFLTFLCEQPNGEACLVRLNGDVWESASATGEPNWIASPVADASESREGAAYAYFYYAHTIGGEFDDTPEPDQAPTATCQHCGRTVTLVGSKWLDPEATGDDVMWRETCDSHDTFTAEHEPMPGLPPEGHAPWLADMLETGKSAAEPTSDPAPAKLKGLSDIDWSGPATEIRDALVEIWFERHHWVNRDSETLAEAEAWADERFAENAEPRADEEGK